MPISQARMVDWKCASCGEATSQITWLAADAVERPDLIERLSDLIESECSSCDRPLNRTMPLLVLRLAKTAPLIAARASGDDLDPIESLGEIVAVVRHELGDAVRDVPGPPAVVTFDEIEAGVGRDIDADAEALRAGASDAARYEPAYRRLLMVIEVNQRRQRIDRGLEELALVGSEQQLREVVGQWPELITDEAEHRVAHHVEEAATEGQRHFAVSMLQTVRLVRQGDFSGAWSMRESVIRAFWEETVAPRLRAFEDARRDASWLEVAQAGRDLLDVLPPGTHPELQADVAGFTATALLHNESADREQRADEAIELGQFAISMLDAFPDIDTPQRRIPILSNLGTAFGFRPRGDPVWNYEQSLTYLTDVIALSWQAGDRDGWAMAQTNLADTLINRGDAGDYDRAREHLALALTHRSRQRNAGDWAFTQLHVGLSYSRDDSGDRAANIQEAIRHFARARDAARSGGDIPLLAQAAHNLAVEQLSLSRMPGTAPAVQSKLLDRAEASALESARLSSAGESPVRFGHAWLMIGKIRATRADRGGATTAFKTALSALTASTAPSETREASRLLLELAEAQGDVELAADTAARLVEAAAAAISARSRAEDRISEHRGRKTTDFRFAANALVRANRLDEAVAALELGRTRELGLLTLDERIDLDLLAHLDPGLRDDVQEVRTSFRADILGLEERSAVPIALKPDR